MVLVISFSQNGNKSKVGVNLSFNWVQPPKLFYSKIEIVNENMFCLLSKDYLFEYLLKTKLSESTVLILFNS